MLKLKIDGLSCSIKSKEILKDITVSFQQGEMAAVLGRNGAGKTTFIRCIADLIPHQGSIVLEEDGKKLDRSSIAYLPQLEKITSSLTTFETILLGLTKKLSWKVSEASACKSLSSHPRAEAGYLCQYIGAKFERRAEAACFLSSVVCLRAQAAFA